MSVEDDTKNLEAGGREVIAWVLPRHSAYLIMLNDTLDCLEGITPVDSFDAANSLTNAKIAAMEMTRGYGFEGYVWQHVQSGTWRLWAKLPREVEAESVECYSDHDEDIRTKGSCDYCHDTEPIRKVDEG